MDEKKLPCINHRSPGRATARVCEALNSEKLILLAAVSSPLLSPGRERAKRVRKQPKQSSIFAFSRKAKVSIEAEEPSSPKVSCIGKVKASKNTCGSNTKERQQNKPHASSKRVKWASLFSLRRGSHCSESRGPPCGGSEVSRFGLPSWELAFFCSGERSCGAVFAKSLILLQESGDKTQLKSSSDVQTVVCNDGNRDQRKVCVPIAQFACMQGGLDNGKNGSEVSSLNLAAHNIDTHDTLCTFHKESKEHTSSDFFDTEKNKPPTLSGVIHAQERLAVRVAMEALPCKDCESLDPDTALPLNDTCDRAVGSSGDGRLCTVRTPIIDMADVGPTAVVEDEETINSNIQMSCKLATRRQQDCDKGHCEVLKECNTNDSIVPNGVDKHEGQAQQFCDDPEPKRKLFDVNMIDCVVPSILAFPQLSERDLQCFLMGKDTDSAWDIHLDRRSDSAQAAFIFLDYSLYGNLFKKDTREAVTSSQLWTLRSFNGASGEAKLLRSHSATSYRATITIRRCKSEPRKPY
ncbi:hypothetical protein GOP47_0006674 [Adiantum capillus-veneris]|uniref:Uncharacterized protein n=1 Tax=Adiantum capillus-veneris TaxID=13818 RepID=A0A9D4V3I9_ADICA|nr:hypothetical protein GOP47_0006674 [Adiantum capillus-veneris]